MRYSLHILAHMYAKCDQSIPREPRVMNIFTGRTCSRKYSCLVISLLEKYNVAKKAKREFSEIQSNQQVSIRGYGRTATDGLTYM